MSTVGIIVKYSVTALSPNLAVATVGICAEGARKILGFQTAECWNIYRFGADGARKFLGFRQLSVGIFINLAPKAPEKKQVSVGGMLECYWFGAEGARKILCSIQLNVGIFIDWRRRRQKKNRFLVA